MPRNDASSKLDKLKSKIGKITDAEIAELAGVSIGSVRLYRKRHGIAAARVRRGKKSNRATKRAQPAAKIVQSRTKEERKTRGRDRKPRRSKVGALRHLLGQIPDAEVAKQAGVSIEAVRMYRRRHAIAGPQKEAAVVGTPRRRKSALDPYFDLLGTVPDSEIAVMAGVTNENVRAYRRRHGIDASWKGARPHKPLVTSAPQISPPVPVSTGQIGYLVSLEGQEDRVVVAADFVTAARVASAASTVRVLGLRVLGPVLG